MWMWLWLGSEETSRLMPQQWYSRQTQTASFEVAGGDFLYGCDNAYHALDESRSSSEANLVMVYLLAIVKCSKENPRVRQSCSFKCSSVVIFDLLFTQAVYRITVYDSQYLVTFAVMLIVGLLASTLTSRIRYQADTAREMSAGQKRVVST